MKKLLSVVAVVMGFSTAASAADFPVYPAKAALPMPVIFSWTGCYVGAVGGWNQGHSEQIARASQTPVDGLPLTGKFDMTGSIAGGTIGCNIQISNFVIGAENDFSWTNTNGTVAVLPPFVAGGTSGTREKWMDTFRGRFGYAIDRFMIYGTAGVAVTGTDVTVSNPALFGTVTSSMQRTGWVVGLGGEFAVWSAGWADVTLKVEYLHAGFESKQYFVPPVVINGITIVTRDTALSNDMVRAGLNFKFNWDSPSAAPIGARY
jgi:outer membrane immunogenic protein